MAAGGLRPLTPTPAEKLELNAPGHPGLLQRHLHQQWLQGHNCDLVISARACRIPVHAAVASCFSSKIGQHLLKAQTAPGPASLGAEKKRQCSLVEGGVHFSFCEVGLSRVDLDVDEEIVKTLVGFMYTGSLSVTCGRTLLLVEIAQLLGMEAVVDVLRVYLERNPGFLKSCSQTSSVQPKQISLPPGETCCGEERGDDPHSEDCTPIISDQRESCGHSDDKADVSCSDSVSLEVKQEVVDADVNAMIHNSTGDEETGMSEEWLSGLTSHGQVRGMQSELSSPDDVCSSGRLVVKIEQELWCDTPLHFETPRQQEREQLQQDHINSENETGVGNVSSSDVDTIVAGNLKKMAMTPSELNFSKVGKDVVSCAHCKQAFRYHKSLQNHLVKKHLICPHCKEQLKDRMMLEEHCRTAHKDYRSQEKSRDASISCSAKAKSIEKLSPPFSCQHCDKQFRHRQSYQRHEQKAHNQKSVKGLQSETSFADDRTQGLHSQEDEDEQPQSFSLDVNGNSSVSPIGIDDCVASEISNLEEVLSAVQAQLSCEEDQQQEEGEMGPQLNDVSLAREGADSEEKRKRTGRIRWTQERNAGCPLCDQKFDTVESQFQHLRSHHPTDCFPCQQCYKTFPRQSSLTCHVLASHVRRLWTCVHCGEVFNTTTKFSVHNKQEHDDDKPFRCGKPSCAFTSRSWKAMVTHGKSRHATERNQVCDACGKRFPTKQYLRLHQRNCLRLEQHLCSTCGEVFSLRQTLHSHINTMHGGHRRYGCAQCGQLFSCHANRNRHMRIHDNVYPYVCDVCGQKFRHTNSLKDHVRRKHSNG